MQKTSAPEGSAAWREGPQASAEGVPSAGGVSDAGRTDRKCFRDSTGGFTPYMAKTLHSENTHVGLGCPFSLCSHVQDL